MDDPITSSTQPLLESLATVLEEVRAVKAQMRLIRLLSIFDLFLLDLGNRTASSMGHDSAFHAYIKQMREILADQDLLALNMDRSIELELKIEPLYRYMRESVPVRINDSFDKDLEEFALWNLSEITEGLTKFWKQS